MDGSETDTPLETNLAQSIDWYAEGESRVIRIADIEVCVRLVGRKGRRARICLTAPAGAAFEQH